MGTSTSKSPDPNHKDPILNSDPSFNSDASVKSADTKVTPAPYPSASKARAALPPLPNNTTAFGSGIKVDSTNGQPNGNVNVIDPLDAEVPSAGSANASVSGNNSGKSTTTIVAENEKDPLSEHFAELHEDDEDILTTASSTSAPIRTASGVTDKLGSVVRWLSDSLGRSNDAAMHKKLMGRLRKSTMFSRCSEASLLALAESMDRVDFKRGDVLMVQGEPQQKAMLIISGEVVRMRLIDDQLHTTETLGAATSKSSIGMLHLMNKDKTWSTVKSVSNGTAYVLTSEAFRDLLETDPDFSREVIQSLCKQIRTTSRKVRTPLFLQTGKALPVAPLPWFAISCAAALESFYRSGVNAVLNQLLAGGTRGPLFPNMHIQLPSRIVYINGFKGIRHVLDSKFDPNDFPYMDEVDPNVVGMALAVLPGLIMTPLSSILEASNAGHMNKEAMSIRWTRGLAPRCAREVIFGIGINQLSDYVEERLDFIPSQVAQNVLGSMLAGCAAGYLSHLPHNLSALKVLKPHMSYAEHFSSLAKEWHQSVRVLAPKMRPAAQRRWGNVLAVALPKGCLIRTAQIAGSFIIINSAVNALRHITVNVSVSRAGL